MVFISPTRVWLALRLRSLSPCSRVGCCMPPAVWQPHPLGLQGTTEANSHAHNPAQMNSHPDRLALGARPPWSLPTLPGACVASWLRRAPAHHAPLSPLVRPSPHPLLLTLSPRCILPGTCAVPWWRSLVILHTAVTSLTFTHGPPSSFSIHPTFRRTRPYLREHIPPCRDQVPASAGGGGHWPRRPRDGQRDAARADGQGEREAKTVS